VIRKRTGSLTLSRNKKAGTPSTTPDAPAARDYAAADTKPNALSDAATPRTPPPPRTSNCPAAADGHTMTGTDTRHERTWPPMTGPGRTATERLICRDHDRANADATACSANDATATRPDDARSDTRQDTKPQPPARKADHTTDESEGSQEDETTMYLPM